MAWRRQRQRLAWQQCKPAWAIASKMNEEGGNENVRSGEAIQYLERKWQLMKISIMAWLGEKRNISKKTQRKATISMKI
jgi:hypothetical protein